MNLPLVTVLLCHHRLRHMVQMAIDSYLSQDYENRELLVVDDGPESIGDLVKDIPRCLYINHPAKNLSEKRNVGAREARGEFIVNFDADDWSGPHRITDQVEMMQRNSSQIGGYGKAFWYDFVYKKSSYYQGFLWGASMIYRRDYALAHPWDETCSIAEDQRFLGPARERKSVVACAGDENFVATMHDRNVHRPAGTSSLWPFVAVETLPEGFRKAAGLWTS